MATSVVGVNCGLLNVQSVRNKTLEIRDTINEKKLDLYAVTETWLSNCDNAVIEEMTPVTHSFINNPRNEGRGGGVGLFITNSISKVVKCNSNVYDAFEHLKINCEISGNRMTIITVYRPPNTNSGAFIREFGLFLETIDMVSANIIILGDFNL